MEFFTAFVMKFPIRALNYTECGKKVAAGNFCRFLKTAGNFDIKFYMYIQGFHLHLHKKLNLINFNNGEVIVFRMTT